MKTQKRNPGYDAGLTVVTRIPGCDRICWHVDSITTNEDGSHTFHTFRRNSRGVVVHNAYHVSGEILSVRAYYIPQAQWKETQNDEPQAAEATED